MVQRGAFRAVVAAGTVLAALVIPWSVSYRWTSGPLDPVRTMQDPPAGQWFSQMALELARNANQPLSPS